MREQLKKGFPANFLKYSGNTPGTILEVGVGRAYANLASAMSYIATQTWESSTALSGTVTTTASSASITGTGLSSISPDDYLLVGANYLPVKSIESGSAATLWSGSPASVASQPATIKKLKKFTIILYENQTVSTASFPDGVSVLLVGVNSGIRISATGQVLSITSYFKLEITSLQLYVSTNYLLFGALGTGRGIINIHDVTNVGVSLGVLIFGATASFTYQNISGTSARTSIQTDYLYVNNVHIKTSDPNDVFLASQVFATDQGHPYAYNAYTVINVSNSTAGQNAGLEINAIPATKIINVTNSKLISFDTIAGAYPMWLSNSGGVYTFTNCTIDALNSTFEVYDRRLGVGSLTFIATTRLNGGAVRVTT